MTANAATVWKKPISALLQVDPNRDQGNGNSVWEVNLTWSHNGTRWCFFARCDVCA